MKRVKKLKERVIDRKNALPLYVQLKEIIKSKIDQKEWEEGDPIPTEMELIDKYQVSRTTVRQALSDLVMEGALYKMQGRGTFVAEPKLEAVRPKLTGFMEDMQDEGHTVDSIILREGWESVKGEEWNVFGLKEGGMLYKLDRLRRVNEKVIGIQETTLNMELYPELDLSTHDFSRESLYEVLKKYSIPLGEAKETVEASYAGDVYGDIMNVPSETLILKLYRRTTLQSGELFEIGNMIFLADKYKYKTTLRGY